MNLGGGLLETYVLQVVGSERRCIHAIQYVYKTIVSFSQTCHSNKARVAEHGVMADVGGYW